MSESRADGIRQRQVELIGVKTNEFGTLKGSARFLGRSVSFEVDLGIAPWVLVLILVRGNEIR